MRVEFPQHIISLGQSRLCNMFMSSMNAHAGLYSCDKLKCQPDDPDFDPIVQGFFLMAQNKLVILIFFCFYISRNLLNILQN